MSVELNLDCDDAAQLYAELLRARDGLRAAIADGHAGNVGYFFGYLDKALTALADACPPGIKPSARPPTGWGNVHPRSGGGAKPV